LTTILYGIRYCDTITKARAWPDAHRVACVFHGCKTAGINRDRLQRWYDMHCARAADSA
jgi:arsenate reductase